MADRTIVLATNGRHAVRGLTAVNTQEFKAYQEIDDNLTYVVDMSSYLDGDTISTVTRTANGPTVSNTSNTTTRLTQRLKGFGYVDFTIVTTGGDTEEFRITIEPRAGNAFFLTRTGSGPDNTAQFFNTVADVNSSNVDTGVDWVRTAGYYTTGDGGDALYKRVSAAPSHSAYITSNSGNTYWELTGGYVNAKQFGAKGDGSTDDTAAFTSAESSPFNVIVVPEGTYVTSKAPQGLSNVYLGSGKISLSGDYAAHKTPSVYTYISSAPSSVISGRDPAQEFNGDFKSPLAFQQYVTGTTTAGQPTTGYRNNPELSQIRAHCYSDSGYNHSTSDATGRTSIAQLDLYHVMAGRGDAMNILAGGYISNPAPSRNSKALPDPALTMLGGGVTATSAAVNLVGVELQLDDNGNACTGAGVGINLRRTVDPGVNSKSYAWTGFSCRATASSFKIDAGFHLSGTSRIGIDFSAATFDTDQGAIALAANQRIHFECVNTSYIGQPEGTALGDTYINYESASSSWKLTVNASNVIQATSSSVKLKDGTNTRLETNGTGIGFFGTAPTAKATITGSRAGNAALANLLTELAAKGLITDSTTA